MKVALVRALLEREDDEATVRVTVDGDRPMEVRAVASAGENVVLMAVPRWNFDEIEDALAMVPKEGDALLLPWDDVFIAKNGEWFCRKHDLGFKYCDVCKLKVEKGWHWGSSNKTSRYCNTHTQGKCDPCPPDRYSEVMDD